MFLKKESNISRDQEEQVPFEIMNHPAKNELSDAINGKLIHFNIVNV